MTPYPYQNPMVDPLFPLFDPLFLGLWEEAHAPPDRDPPKAEITFDPSYSQLI